MDFQISGPIPAGGISISMTRDGETETGIYSQAAANVLASLGKINRTMSARGVNNDWLGISDGYPNKRTLATRWTGPVNPNEYAPLCIEAQVSACVKGGMHLWHNTSDIDTERGSPV